MRIPGRYLESGTSWRSRADSRERFCNQICKQLVLGGTICQSSANGVDVVYFDIFNDVYPLYNRSIFDEHLHRQYSSNPPESVAWYASLNVVIAIGILSERMQCIKPNTVGDSGPSYEISWKYFRNATSCFTELLFTDVSLMAVAALTGMVRLSDSKG